MIPTLLNAHELDCKSFFIKMTTRANSKGAMHHGSHMNHVFGVMAKTWI